MSGLRTYTRHLIATEPQTLSARGSTVIVRSVVPFAAVVSVSISQNQIGAKSGSTYNQLMRRGEKWFAGEEFDSVIVECSEDAQVELLVGYGDYVTPPKPPNEADALPDVYLERTYAFTLAGFQEAIEAAQLLFATSYNALPVFSRANIDPLDPRETSNANHRFTVQCRAQSDVPIYIRHTKGSVDGHNYAYIDYELAGQILSTDIVNGIELLPGQSITLIGGAQVWIAIAEAGVIATPTLRVVFSVFHEFVEAELRV